MITVASKKTRVGSSLAVYLWIPGSIFLNLMHENTHVQPMIRLLFVDDEPELLAMSRIYLEKGGEMSVATAISAVEALRLLGQQKFDAIVSDHIMPGMDGLELLKTIRNNGDRTPFIIYSGKGREHVILEALNGGADFFIQKGGDAMAQYAEMKHKILLVVKERQTEAALRESEARYRGVVEDQTEFICRFRPDGTITFVNAAYCRYFGRSFSEVIGIRFSPRIPEEEKILVRNHFRSLTAEHPFAMLEHSTIAPGGEVRWQQWNDRAITDDEGRVIEYQSVGRDITDRVKTEEELKRYSGHLEELVEERTRKLKEAERFSAIGETAHIVGHDLRNPLQVILFKIFIGQTKMEQMSHDERAVITKYQLNDLWKTIEDQVLYMNKIILDLQDYARPLEVKRSLVPLRDLIEDVISTTDCPKEVTLTIDIDPAFVIEADPYLFRRIVSNLLMNAFQAITGAGKVTVSAYRNDYENVIEIRDTGTGMNEAELQKVFSPLYTTKPKGTGLGLNVSERLIREHDGNLVLKSKPKEGTTAVITLPVREVRSGTS
jgi:PAS domain S-box-containing protein